MFTVGLMFLLAIQDCIDRIRHGLSSPQREARQKRREQRNRMRAEQETVENRMRQLQLANETKQAELEAMNKVLCRPLYNTDSFQCSKVY